MSRQQSVQSFFKNPPNFIGSGKQDEREGLTLEKLRGAAGGRKKGCGKGASSSGYEVGEQWEYLPTIVFTVRETKKKRLIVFC